jgi:hypothetical protein
MSDNNLVSNLNKKINNYHLRANKASIDKGNPQLSTNSPLNEPLTLKQNLLNTNRKNSVMIIVIFNRMILSRLTKTLFSQLTSKIKKKSFLKQI